MGSRGQITGSRREFTLSSLAGWAVLVGLVVTVGLVAPHLEPDEDAGPDAPAFMAADDCPDVEPDWLR